jgi:GGDEF domain-containing protein
MGMQDAKKYIKQLHKRQDNPNLWPDYLTGLPDKAAIIKKMELAFPKLGTYSMAYVKIGNIHPYIIKYGADNHADIIQWAAAILHTTSKKCKDSFVGTISTHDFLVICKTKNMNNIIKEANRLFNKRIQSYYSKTDLRKKTTLSFRRDGGEKVHVGLIKFIYVVADRKLKTKRSHLIQDMGKVCQAMEGTDQDYMSMTEELVCGV